MKYDTDAVIAISLTAGSLLLLLGLIVLGGVLLFC